MATPGPAPSPGGVTDAASIAPALEQNVDGAAEHPPVDHNGHVKHRLPDEETHSQR